MTTTATARAHGVEATVHPGGILSSLSITTSALRRPDLATVILTVIDQATAEANTRIHHLLNGADPTLLGLPTPAPQPPETWRVQ
ncbi:hypothetical protein [Actinokineospora cianjurensis]|uniref:YbaB/EbfC DNA-binding family protein n=1 Tax=Actinokineospora cianjurensis TaxID=585224 RepID=A0A421BB29_9PSEU|nr:hypothetical protein [Actinokineospora cianjurensis]RLK61483.1 hypothetical protein CLV68_2024 [Actinokineospora cianjurensis]